MALLQNAEETHWSRWLVFFQSARFKDCLEILLESKSTFVATQGWASQANWSFWWWCSHVHLCHICRDSDSSQLHGAAVQSGKLEVKPRGKLCRRFWSFRTSLQTSLKVMAVTRTGPATVWVFEVVNNLQLSPFEAEKGLSHKLLFTHFSWF